MTSLPGLYSQSSGVSNTTPPRPTKAYGMVKINGQHDFLIEGFVMRKCRLFFTLVYRGTLTLPEYCDLEFYGADSTPLFTMRQFSITSAGGGGPVSCVDGTLSIILPVSLDKVNFGPPLPEKRGTDLPYAPAKVYPFTDAIVGNKAYTYQQADGGMVYGEFGWVTDLDYFDDRDREVRLIRKKWVLLEVDEVVLEDPYPPLLEDLDEVV